MPRPAGRRRRSRGSRSRRVALPRHPDPTAERSTIAPAAIGTQGISPAVARQEGPSAGRCGRGPEPNNVQFFFGIYFAMTGLHGVHVIAGMAVIAWMLVRARRGEFSPGLFHARRFHRPVLAPGRPDLDIFVSVVVLDSVAN